MTESVVRKEVHITSKDLTSFIVSLGGIKFWAVAIFPMYVGWVLAQPAPDRHLFIDDLSIVLGLVVIGPLLGTFTLLLNAYYDMDTTDRVNPRKEYARAIEDVIDRETVWYAGWGFGGLGLLLAAFVSVNVIPYNTGFLGPYGFLALMAGAAAMSVAYSHSRIYLKGVAGWDLVINVIGFGIICPLAGWSLVRPFEEFPAWYLLSVALFVGAAYAPTTASDYASDKAYGIRTLAVALGPRNTMVLGLGLLVAAIAVLAAGALAGWFPFVDGAQDSLRALWPFLAAQIVLYAAFTPKPTQGKIWALILLLSILQFLATTLFLYYFVRGVTYP